jgi:predicted transcriptional regulator
MIVIQTKKPRLTKAVVIEILTKLISHGMVEINTADINKDTLYRVVVDVDCGNIGSPTYANIILGLASIYINRGITPTDILIYLYLRRNVYDGKDTLQLVMQEVLGIDQRNISKRIGILGKCGILKVKDRVKSGKHYYNIYEFPTITFIGEIIKRNGRGKKDG